MKLLIVPKPVLNNTMEVMYYCFRHHKADELVTDQPSRAFEGALSSPCLDVLSMVSLDAFTNGIPIFVPLNKLTLFANIESICPVEPEKVIFMFDNDLEPEEPFLSAISRLKALGYRIALENVSDLDRMRPVLELCDFMFMNGQIENFRLALDDVTRRHKDIVCLAAQVHSVEDFDRIKFSKFVGFEGRFYSVPAVKKGQNTIAPIKVNRIQLLNTVRSEDFDIDDIVKIVSQDPALSISLLKFVNSSHMALSQRIKTIQHAVAMLGQAEVRKWVTTATSGLLADDRPDEMTKLSLVRAKFAENMAPQFEMAIHAPSLFLMGLFSILDAVLEVPMEEALKIVKVSDKIHDALVGLKGDFARVLSFIYAYESANWNEVCRLIVLNNLNPSEIFKAYIETVRWYDSVVSSSGIPEE